MHLESFVCQRERCSIHQTTTPASIRASFPLHDEQFLRHRSNCGAKQNIYSNGEATVIYIFSTKNVDRGRRSLRDVVVAVLQRCMYVGKDRHQNCQRLQTMAEQNCFNFHFKAAASFTQIMSFLSEDMPNVLLRIELTRSEEFSNNRCLGFYGCSSILHFTHSAFRKDENFINAQNAYIKLHIHFAAGICIGFTLFLFVHILSKLKL